MSEFLTITLDELELWDENISQFITTPKEDVTFKYTLKVLDLWETKYKKRFIDNGKNIEQEEFLDFIVMMADRDIDVSRLSEENFKDIIKYIETTPTATELPKNNNSSRGKEYHRKKIFTSEIIYAMMALNHIPFDWENRNLNKLIMLLNCVGSLQEPPKKMTKAEAMDEHYNQVMRNRKIMEERRKQMNG